VTITLRVREVLRNPAQFVSSARLAVDGVLLLADDDFRILQADDAGLDEGVSLPIDDPLAAAKLREALPRPPPGGWWYFGRALVEAWTRRDPAGWVLHEIVSVWLEEPGGDGSLRVEVRPHPWGWDRSS
jgi:hypothetical protein